MKRGTFWRLKYIGFWPYSSEVNRDSSSKNFNSICLADELDAWIPFIWSSHEELLHEQQDHMVKLKAKINGENNWKVFDWRKKMTF
jgi:hypothetical protein